MLAHRDRGLLAGGQLDADHLQGGAGKRQVVGVERGALEHVAGADEAGDEFRLRPVIDIFGGAELVDPAAVHHRDQVGGGHRLGLVVGDVHRGVAVFVVQPPDLEAHLLAQIGVEVGQRLVEQQRLRFHDQRPRQRHALLLAARQFARITLGQYFELGGGEDRLELPGDGVAVELAQPQAVDDVFRHRHVRPQRVALEDHRHLALLGRQRPRFRGHQPVADMDFAVGGFQKAGHQPQCGGLAAARRSEQAHQLAMVDAQRDVIDDRERFKSLGQAAQFNGRHSTAPQRTRRYRRPMAAV